jgi:ornithine decarboxylase
MNIVNRNDDTNAIATATATAIINNTNTTTDNIATTTTTDNIDINIIINDYIKNNKDNEHFIIVDLGDIKRKYYQWNMLLPKITPYYAIKCNPNNKIISLLHSLGCHFDAASKNEIVQLLGLNIEPSKIIYANPCKSVDFIKFSRTNDINLLVIDCPNELYKIKLYHPEANVILRIKTDDSKSICKFNSKFGVNMNEVKSILELSIIMNIKMCGVSFHVGSGCQDENVYKTAISNCRTVFDIAKNLNIQMNILDIGGGFPGNNYIKFENIATIINSSIDEFFKDEPAISFIAEPGRYFVASSHTLVCSIINKKEIVDETTNDIKYIYYISDGVYGSFSGMLFDYAKYEIIPFTDNNNNNNNNNNKTFSSIVFGPTCDSLDIISNNCQLPSLSIGEKVIIRDIGAYSVASSTEFNGFTRPDIHYIMTS